MDLEGGGMSYVAVREGLLGGVMVNCGVHLIKEMDLDVLDFLNLN